MGLLIVWISMVFTTVADTRRLDRSVIPLDMAPNSVDDDYKGCSAKMSKLVNTKYLPLEKTGNFSDAWRQAEEQIQNDSKLIPESDNLTMNHAIAIRVYTYEIPNIYKPFNMAVCSSRKSYGESFKNHSLHFLLTDAIQRLNPNGNCFNVFRGTNLTFSASVQDQIRFGSFTSTSLNPRIAEEFGDESCFAVRTCHGAKLSNYSFYKSEEEVLIPPYEKFELLSIEKHPMDLECDTVYHLRSIGTQSYLRCAISSSTYHGYIFGFMITGILLFVLSLAALVYSCHSGRGTASRGGSTEV